MKAEEEEEDEQERQGTRDKRSIDSQLGRIQSPLMSV
jgi:hypothetical protein